MVFICHQLLLTTITGIIVYHDLGLGMILGQSIHVDLARSIIGIEIVELFAPVLVEHHHVPEHVAHGDLFIFVVLGVVAGVDRDALVDVFLQHRTDFEIALG